MNSSTQSCAIENLSPPRNLTQPEASGTSVSRKSFFTITSSILTVPTIKDSLIFQLDKGCRSVVWTEIFAAVMGVLDYYLENGVNKIFLEFILFIACMDNIFKF